MRQWHSSSIQIGFLLGSSHGPSAANDALIESICSQKFYYQKIIRIDFTAGIPTINYMAAQANSIHLYIFSHFSPCTTVVCTVHMPKSKKFTFCAIVKITQSFLRCHLKSRTNGKNSVQWRCLKILFEINCCQFFSRCASPSFYCSEKCYKIHRSGNNTNDINNKWCAGCTQFRFYTQYAKILLWKENVTIAFLFGDFLCMCVDRHSLSCPLFFLFPLQTELLEYEKENFFVLLFFTVRKEVWKKRA